MQKLMGVVQNASAFLLKTEKLIGLLRDLSHVLTDGMPFNNDTRDDAIAMFIDQVFCNDRPNQISQFAIWKTVGAARLAD